MRAKAMLAASLAGLLVSKAVHPASPPPESPVAPHVLYFAEGIEAPLATMYRINKGVDVCSRRFPECKKVLEEDDGDSPLDTDPLIDLGPLFASTLSGAPTPPMSSATEGLENLRVLWRRLDSETRAYDRQFVVRYGTVLVACSSENGERLIMLGNVMRYDVERFEGQTEAEFARVSDEAWAESQRQGTLLKAQWTAATCQKALELGHALWVSYWHKVKPLAVDGWQEVKANRSQLNVGHVWEAAYALAAEHDPSVATRIDEYYRAKETATKD
jgi:hypothetical protein